MTLRVTHTGLEVRFTSTEKVLGLVRDTDVPFSAIRDVSVVPDGLDAPTGLRAPGYSWPRSRKLGTWRGRGVKSLVDVRRGQPALCVELVGHRYDRLVVGAEDAERLASEIAARLGTRC
jgi:hypothetical protein